VSDPLPPGQERPASREYPARPVVGVGGVVLVPGDGPDSPPRVLLIRRRFPPLAGRWSLPGGTLEVGETLQEGLAREMREETGLEVEVGQLVEVFDRITRDAGGRVQFHFVLADYVCRPTGGTLQADSDASDATWADTADLAPYGLADTTRDVISKAVGLAFRTPAV
jgi:ADP-ribose pyrophosphatase YjhB (NUDIX family)